MSDTYKYSTLPSSVWQSQTNWLATLRRPPYSLISLITDVLIHGFGNGMTSSWDQDLYNSLMLTAKGWPQASNAYHRRQFTNGYGKTLSWNYKFDITYIKLIKVLGLINWLKQLVN